MRKRFARKRPRHRRRRGEAGATDMMGTTLKQCACVSASHPSRRLTCVAVAAIAALSSGCSERSSKASASSEKPLEPRTLSIDVEKRRVTVPAVAVKQNMYLELKGGD